MKIQNISNLFRAYYIENARRDIYLLAVVAALAFVASLLGGQHYTLVYWVLLMAFVVQQFGLLRKNTGAVHYLTLPADTGEKFLFAFLMVNVVSLLEGYLVILIGSFLGQLTHALLEQVWGTGQPFDIEMPTVLWGADWKTTAMAIYVPIAILFFSGIYFRRNPVAKTIMTLVLLGLALLILAFITVKVNMWMAFPAGTHLRDVSWESLTIDTWPEWSAEAASAVAIVYCYVLSFLRLRETEA